jgi:hypothetical protein
MVRFRIPISKLHESVGPLQVNSNIDMFDTNSQLSACGVISVLIFI